MTLSCSWSGYADTDLDFSEFFGKDHTVAVRFMQQYPNAYTGPMVSVNGAGTYILGQSDFYTLNAAGLTFQLGNGVPIVYQTAIQPGTWHHLAVVRSGNTFRLYLDGVAVGGSMPLPSSGLPSGKVRFGKSTFTSLDGGGTQFYGFLDDMAFVTAALSDSELKGLASQAHLTGTERALHAGYTFGYMAAGSPAALTRPVSVSVGADVVSTSPLRDNADAALMSLGLASFMHLPFPPGEALFVIQGFDDAAGSHKGYASFSLDLRLAAGSQADSNGKPFYAAAAGTVVYVQQEGVSGPSGPANVISVQQDTLEFADYLHCIHEQSQVKTGDAIVPGQHLANIGDTGVGIGAFHLHIALTNIGEHKHGTPGESFVTVPSAYSNYEASDDGGHTWYHVRRGVPKHQQQIRRPVTANPVHYSAVWQASTAPEAQTYGAPYSEYRKQYDALWPQGWRLKLLSIYTADQPRYTAVWQPGTEGEVQIYGATYDQYRAKYDELWPQGWRLKLLVPYVAHGVVQYTAAWRPDTHGELQVYGWEYEDFRPYYDVLWKKGWRLHMLSVLVD